MTPIKEGNSNVFKKFYMQKIRREYRKGSGAGKWDEVETLREFTYLGDRVSAGGGCETTVTARTRSG